MIKLLIITLFISTQVEAKSPLIQLKQKPLSLVEISYGSRYKLNKEVSDLKFILTPNPKYEPIWINKVKDKCKQLEIECQIFPSANNPQLINIYSVGKRVKIIQFMDYLKSISMKHQLKK